MMGHMNYGRLGGSLPDPPVAPPEQPQVITARDYTPLEQRAILAFLDRREDQQNAVLRAVHEAVLEVLETEEFEIEEIQGNDRAIVVVDGMKFRVTTGTRRPQTSSGQTPSNSTIEGIHDEEFWTFAVSMNNTFHAISSLADLGALVK